MSDYSVSPPQHRYKLGRSSHGQQLTPPILQTTTKLPTVETRNNNLCNNCLRVTLTSPHKAASQSISLIKQFSNLLPRSPTQQKTHLLDSHSSGFVSKSNQSCLQTFDRALHRNDRSLQLIPQYSQRCRKWS